jgi:ribokinase
MNADGKAAVVVVGSCNLDLIVEVPQLPVAGQTMLGADVVSRPGGKGANQAVAARRLGATTALVAAIGHDQFGATLHTALATEGVDLTDLVTLAGPSGVALIVVDPHGENVIAVASGANRRLRPEHLGGLDARLTPASVLLMQLETPLDTCRAAAGIARDAGARVVLNAAPIPDPATDDLRRLLALTDVLVVNEGEALALCPRPTQPATTAEWESVAAALRELGPAVAIVTLGEAGAVVADADGTAATPAYPVTAVDTTGAGDAFCGAVAAALAGGRAIVDAVELGCLAGALAATAVGAQTALPTAADINRVSAVQAGG